MKKVCLETELKGINGRVARLGSIKTGCQAPKVRRHDAEGIKEGGMRRGVQLTRSLWGLGKRCTIVSFFSGAKSLKTNKSGKLRASQNTFARKKIGLFMIGPILRVLSCSLSTYLHTYCWLFVIYHLFMLCFYLCWQINLIWVNEWMNLLVELVDLVLVVIARMRAYTHLWQNRFICHTLSA